jgi:hypothetical protein
MNIRCESLDTEAALQRHGSTPQLKKRALEILPLCHHNLSLMRLAMSTQNPEAIEHVAHDLVTLLGELSPPATLDLALQIEKMARAKNLTDTDFLMTRFKNELDKLQDHLFHLNETVNLPT